MMEEKLHTLTERALETIRERGIRPRSKLSFALGAAALAALAAGVLALSALIVSFGLFALHESGEQFLLGFGASGVATFFALFPWALLALDLALILALDWLLRRFKFGWRLSVLNFFIILLAVSAALGFLISLTPLHFALRDRADRGELPLFGGFYENIRAPHEDRGVYRGVITGLSGTTFTMQSTDRDNDEGGQGTYTVQVPPGVTLATIPQAGERVFVFGEQQPDGSVLARAVQFFNQ